MNQRCWLTAAIILFLLLVGCKQGSRHESIDLDEIRVVYGREGGIAGIKQEWIIHPDGLIEGPGDEEFLAPPEDVISILESGASSDIEEFAAMETIPDSCCDQFIYRLTFEDGSSPPVDISGAELMNAGVEVTLAGRFVSELVLFHAVKTPARL